MARIAYTLLATAATVAHAQIIINIDAPIVCESTFPEYKRGALFDVTDVCTRFSDKSDLVFTFSSDFIVKLYKSMDDCESFVEHTRVSVTTTCTSIIPGEPSAFQVTRRTPNCFPAECSVRDYCYEYGQSNCDEKACRWSRNRGACVQACRYMSDDECAAEDSCVKDNDPCEKFLASLAGGLSLAAVLLCVLPIICCIAIIVAIVACCVCASSNNSSRSAPPAYGQLEATSNAQAGYPAQGYAQPDYAQQPNDGYPVKPSEFL